LNIVPDTNVLLRAIVRDDEKQARTARHLLDRATSIAVSLPCLCEVAWVLRGGYRFQAEQIAEVMEALINTPNIVVNRPAVEAGIAMLRAGGDFADAVLAYEGFWLGGDRFFTFDRKAAKLLARQKFAAELLD